MVSVFTTASNPANYFKVRALKKLQVKDELIGGTPGDNVFFGQSPLEPFLTLRERIIQKNFGQLPQATVLSLAGATRGLNEADIISAVQRFNVFGELPIPAEGANTCDPLSGCWTERILSVKEYRSIYISAGFQPIFYNGFYNVYEGGLKNYIKKLLNGVIAVMGKMIAPYIIIVGRKK